MGGKGKIKGHEGGTGKIKGHERGTGKIKGVEGLEECEGGRESIR